MDSEIGSTLPTEDESSIPDGLLDAERGVPNAYHNKDSPNFSYPPLQASLCEAIKKLLEDKEQ